MKVLSKKKSKNILLVAISFLLATLLVLSGVGIYLKVSNKDKNPIVEVNPLDFSIDSWDGTVEAVNFNENYAGRGTQTKTINSAASFAHFINEVNNGNSFENYTVYLNSSIDFGGKEISSIGTSETPFKGIFDGGHYTIFNANINGNGLFAYTENATIKNVGLYNCNVMLSEAETSPNAASSLIGTAVNTNIENTFIRLGNGNLVNTYISNNGTHYIKNSFVDSSANGLINTIDTNNSSENQVTISNCYWTVGESEVVENIEEHCVIQNEILNATTKHQFAAWDYDKTYSIFIDWCDYQYVEGTTKLNFNYPIQVGFAKVYKVGSYYESVMVAGDTVVDATNLAVAFEEADKETEAEVNLLVEKIFMEARAEVENTNVTVNAVKDTTIIRGENNADAMFVTAGSSKIVLGTESSEISPMSTTVASEPTLTLDGNREYIEENNLESGALVVANGGDVEIHNNVVIKDNINNTVGYGGAVLVANKADEIKIGATFENCSSTNGGGAVAIVSPAEEQTIYVGSFKNCSSAGKGGALYLSDELPEEATHKMRKLYGENKTIKPTIVTGDISGGSREIISSDTDLNAGTFSVKIYDSCSAEEDGGAIYCTANLTISTSVNGVDVEFTNNSSTGNGGAIYCTGTLTITGAPTFTENSASEKGGAIYSSDVTISGNATFTSNSAVQSGGAIYASDDVTLSDNADTSAIETQIFTGNVATSTTYTDGGGAIWCADCYITGYAEFKSNVAAEGGAIDGRVTVNNTGNALFEGNNATTTMGNCGGGAISTYATTIDGYATFLNNTATKVGGAIEGDNLTINGTATFTGNSANSSSGGAIYVTKVTFNSNSNVTFKNNHVAALSNAYNVTSGGDAIHVYSLGTLNLYGSLTLEDNYNPDTTYGSNSSLGKYYIHQEILCNGTFNLGCDINVLSTSGCTTLGIGDENYISLKTNLSHTFSVYKSQAAIFDNNNTASYIFEDATDGGLINVGATFPFEVVNAPTGAGVNFNDLKANYGVLATGITVSLDCNGGTLDSSEVVVFEGGVYGELPTPTKEGYNFLGWYTEDGTRVTSTTVVDASSIQTLYAKYDASDLTTTYGQNVTFNYYPACSGTYTMVSTNTSVATVIYTAHVVGGLEYSAVIETKGVGEALIRATFTPDDASYTTPADVLYTLEVTQATLETPTNLRWEENENGALSVATWDAVKCGDVSVSYAVVLLDSSSNIVETVTTEDLIYDFASSIKQNAENYDSYMFKITANSNNISLANNSESSESSNTTTVSTIRTILRSSGVEKIIINGNIYENAVEVKKYVLLENERVVITAELAEGYVFDKWFFGESSYGENLYELYSSTNQTSEIYWSSINTIIAYAKIKPIYVTIATNNSNFGSVTLNSSAVTQVEAVYNDTVSLAEDGKLTIGSQVLIPTPATATVANYYTFTGWTGIVNTLTHDVVFMANFAKHINQYTINISSTDTSMGTVSSASVVVDYGTAVSFKDNVLTFGEGDTAQVVTATPNATTNQYIFGFDCWESSIMSTVNGNVEIKAHFTSELNSHDVTFDVDPEGYGSISITSNGETISGSTITVIYGTEITLNADNTLTIGDYTITATPTTASAELTYTFTGWANREGTISEARVITANFTTDTNEYEISFSTNPNNYGSLVITDKSGTTISENKISVLYGTIISYTDGIMTIGDYTIVANPATLGDGFTYSFASWNVNSGTSVQGEMEIVATFTRTANVYTITYLEIEDATFATANPTTYTVETATFTLNNPTHEEYTFVGWKGTGITGTSETVKITKGSTGNRTYTAVWEVQITVTATGNNVNNTYSIDVYQGNTSIGTYSSSFGVILGETYRFEVNANVTSDSANNDYQILRIKLDNITQFTVYSPNETGIEGSSLVDNVTESENITISGKMEIAFEYLTAYMMKVTVPANSITGLTMNLVNSGENVILDYSAQNAYIIADNTPVTFSVNSVPANENVKHSFIGFTYVANGETVTVGASGAGAIYKTNFVHNSQYTNDSDVGVYSYSIIRNSETNEYVEISELTVNTAITQIVTVVTSALPEGVIITIESQDGLNKIIDSDTKSVMLYAGEWTITAGEITAAELQNVFPYFTIKEVDGKLVVVVTEVTAS